MSTLKVCNAPDCNNVFEDNRGQKYCSSKCRQIAYRRRHETVSSKDRSTRKNCRNCGKIYYTHILTREYCSGRCKQQHYRERKKLSKET